MADFEDEVQMSVLTTIFERSTQYEMAFWDMAYGEPATGRAAPRTHKEHPRMQAARIHEDLTLRLDDVDVPRPGRGGVLVRIHAAGVCGTDLHILDGMIKPDPYPMTLGHEAAGVVEAMGDGVLVAAWRPRGRLQQDLLRALRAMPARVVTNICDNEAGPARLQSGRR